MEEETKRRLILHFNLNGTLIMRDEASTIGSEDFVISEIISTMAWGRVEEREKDGENFNIWICANDTLSWIPQGENYISYKYWVQYIIGSF